MTRRGRGPRVLFVGDIGGADTFHVGDEAMFKCDLALLRRLLPDACFTAVSNDPDHTQALYGVDALRWRDTPRAARRADLLVVTGGGNLNSLFPDHLARRLELARRTRRGGGAVVLLGQMLGPYLTPDDAGRLRELLAVSAFIGVRSDESVAIAGQLGVDDGRAFSQIDDAWWAGAEIDADELADMPRCPYTVVTVHPDPRLVVPASVDSFAQQLGRVASETETHLLLVPHCNAPQGPGGSSDVHVATALASLLESAGVSHRSLPVLEPSVVAAITRSSALVISTRYHPLVFAMSGGAPALAMWSDEYVHSKQRGALATVGLEQWMLSIDDALDQGIAPAIRELWTRRHEIRRWLLGQASDLARRSHRRDALLAERLRSVGLPARVPEPVSEGADESSPTDSVPVPAMRWRHLTSPDPGTRRRWTVLDRVRVDAREDHVALVGRLQLPDLEPTEVHLRVHDPALTDRLDASATPLLGVAAILAANTGTDLVVDAPVDAVALGNVDEIAKISRDWWGWRSPEVDAPGVEREREPAAGVGLWFTRGVDSCDTLVRALDGTLVEDGRALRVTHLLGIDWIDGPLATQCAPAVWSDTASTASSLGLPLLRFTTDVRKVLDQAARWEHTHGAVLAALGLMVGPLLGTVIISATAIGETPPALGSHPRLDPLRSSGSTRIRHVGAVARSEKVVRLAAAGWPLDALKVCWETDTPRNCGRCVKCLATMTTLAAAGALEACDRFDAPLSPDAVRAVARADEPLHVVPDTVDDAGAAAATFDPELAEAWAEVEARLRRDESPSGVG